MKGAIMISVFEITLKRDGGHTITITTPSTDAETAVETACRIEYAPFSAVVSVVEKQY
jgi:hypothetical protein